MITLKLPDMVKKVSSMVGDQSVKTNHFKDTNIITISTDAWDFHFEFIPTLGYYIYSSITITNTDKDLELAKIKTKLLKEIITRYSVVTGL